MLSTEVFAPEPASRRRRLGAGSFASVDVVQEGPAAYKTVHDASGADELLDEYSHLLRLHRTRKPDSFFAIPRPYGYCDPRARSLLMEEPPYAGPSRRRQRPFLSLSAFDSLSFTTATYVMDRIYELPHAVGDPIREQFYNKDAQSASAPALCRLYFGEVLDGPATRPGRFFNPANFPLDAARYTALAGPLALPPIEDVAAGMGEMLGHLHWQEVDGQDVEFVMGGDGFDGVRFFAIDFNQESELRLTRNFAY
ncbi:hypothetical protein LshimejAT787_0602770 [Lyophyllum shimeji]|uniref:Uncharacterized protein n=1 Tax=Lyophyllum shimeji TaxID=47721 RepID=A0A9P3UPK9_LYOSH|nr:hypothetical protein LshimejAT787_0602770 [Lyophyllum shimeji]